MCYAIPGKLVEINEKIGIVDYFGEKKKVLIDFTDVSVGDYVYAQGGVLLNKISPKEAEEILTTWQDLFFELKSIDEKLSHVKKARQSKSLLALLQKVNLDKALTRKELLSLLKVNDHNGLKLLFEMANNIRQKEHGNACCVHGIIEFSNVCENQCFYCGIRKGRRMPRYRMDLDEISKVAGDAVNRLGFKALVLQSGEDPWYDQKKLVTIVREIRKLGVLVFLSIGERSKDTYRRLFEEGARAVLLRFETSNEGIFNRLRPQRSLAKRVELIRYIRELGYVLATGFLLGLPEETEQDIINNILLTKELKPHMYSLGPLIPSRQTPLENHTFINKDILLKVIALSRFIDKDSNILVTTALETLDKGTKRQALLSGANSLMINVTPSQYRNLYHIYDNRAGVREPIQETIAATIELLYSLGRAPTDLGIKTVQ